MMELNLPDCLCGWRGDIPKDPTQTFSEMQFFFSQYRLSHNSYYKWEHTWSYILYTPLKSPQNLQPLPFPFLPNESTAIIHWRVDSMLHGNTTEGKEVSFLESKTITALKTDRSGIKWMYRAQIAKHNQLVSIIRMSWENKTQKAPEECDTTILMHVASRSIYLTKFTHIEFKYNLYIAMWPVWLLTGIKCWIREDKIRYNLFMFDLGPLACVFSRNMNITTETLRVETKLKWDWHDTGCEGSLKFQNTFSVLSVNIWVSCTCRYLVTLTLLCSNVYSSLCTCSRGIINVKVQNKLNIWSVVVAGRYTMIVTKPTSMTWFSGRACHGSFS